MEKLIGIQYDDDPSGTILFVAPLGKPYKLPKSIDRKRKLRRMIIAVPPQEDPYPNPLMDADVVEIEVELTANYSRVKEKKTDKAEIEEPVMPRTCKKCNSPMTNVRVCCDDKAMGFKEKWHCSVCKFVLKLKEKDIN